jgi:hypothetical protein
LAPNWYRYLRLLWIINKTTYSSDAIIKLVIGRFLDKNKLSEKQANKLRERIVVDPTIVRKARK